MILTLVLTSGVILDKLLNSFQFPLLENENNAFTHLIGKCNLAHEQIKKENHIIPPVDAEKARNSIPIHDFF